MNGFNEEVYHSLYSIGLCKQIMNYDFENEILYDYLKAFNYRKTRLEALYQIVKYYRINNKYKEAYGYGMLAYPYNYPNDLLFIEKFIHLYLLNSNYPIVSYYTGFYQFSYQLTQEILLEKTIMLIMKVF